MPELWDGTRRRFLGLGSAAAGSLMLPGWALAQRRSAATRRVLYVSGHFSSRDEATVRRAAERIAASAFDVIVLAFVNARVSAGRLKLHYNGLAAGAWETALPSYIRQMQQGGGGPRRVMVSLGGWGNRATFEAARSVGVAKFLDQLDRQFVGPLGLDGIDLDLEPSIAAENTPAGWHAIHDDLGATLVELTCGYRARHPGQVVSHAPISSVAAALYVRDGEVWGVPGAIFEATRQGAVNCISWLNVQFYEAGDPKPVPIAEFYRRELVQPLLGLRNSTAIERPGEVLFPGFEPRYHQTLEFAEAALRPLRGLAGGAFVWEYGQLGGGLDAWGVELGNA